MSGFSGQVSQSSDDADQIALTGVNSTTASFTNFGTTGTVPQNNLGWRFQNVTIAQGSTISAATISTYQISGGTASTGTLDCVAADNEATFTTTTNYLSGLTLTGSGASWTISTVGTTGFVTSVGIAAAAQAVINRGGWSSGNALAVVLRGPSGGTINFRTYNDSPSEAAEISITYTSSSPPGTPTGLAATNATDPVLTFTQGSGTVTDNLAQWSTDDATWNTIDVGSAVTSYTLTAAPANTLIYVRVAAKNTSGTSSYTTSIMCFTGATTTLAATLVPTPPDNTTTGWTNTGGAATFCAALTDGSDSTYAVAATSTGDDLVLPLSTPPSNLIAVVSVTINARMKTTNGADTNSVDVNIVPTDYLTNGNLTHSLQLTTSLTTSLANYNISAAQQPRTQSLAAWTGVLISLVPPDVNGYNQVAELSVTVTYWVASGVTVLVPPTMLGDMNSMRGGFVN
jgi:hypothetical protein